LQHSLKSGALLHHCPIIFCIFFLSSDFIGDNRIELIIQKLLVQMTFSGENYYVGHTSKKNNLWFWITVSTPAR